VRQKNKGTDVFICGISDLNHLIFAFVFYFDKNFLLRSKILVFKASGIILNVKIFLRDMGGQAREMGG